MDQPIVGSRNNLPRLPRPHQANMYQCFHVAIVNDDKDEFISLVKDPGFEEVRDFISADEIFHLDALEIVIAIFNGETQGLIDLEEIFKDGMTPLHLAAIHASPKLTNYFLQRGDKVDAVCDYDRFKLKNATPFDMIIQSIMCATEGKSLFEKLWRVCYHHREGMEVIRLLVRSMQNTTWTRQMFLKYAHKGELRNLATLFLAVPELFLSSPESELSLLSKLHLKLNSLENKTDVEKQLSLLLDVFAVVGQKLAAYIRLDIDYQTTKINEENKYVPKRNRFQQSHLELDFFLREVADRKQGASSPDYYLSFFEVDQQNIDDDEPWEDWVSFFEDEMDVFDWLPDLLMRKDFDRTDIYRLIPSLKHQDAALLTRAIEKKLSSVSALPGFLETSSGTSKIIKERQIYQLPAFPVIPTRRFEPLVRSFHTSTGSANPKVDVRFTPRKSWENKVIQSSKLKSFFPSVKLSHLPLVAKRLLK